MPFAIKEEVARELDRLEAEGIIERVESSEWAAPIVTVPKKGGMIRICGDYKVTINPHLDIDVHPLPRTEELFAALSGRQKFTKLDLSHAYQQLPLDEHSKKLVTVNTHKGLYRYNRLPFGVASAPAIFQRTMDSILQGLDNVVCFIDDILITGCDDSTHLWTLEKVLQRLHSHGVVVKKEKCVFMSESVEYLGHILNSQGMQPTPNKIEAIINAPNPRNVHELRSFLGLMNYYNKFIPHLASILHPLHCLLRKKSKWEWSEACDKAVERAKRELVSPRVLMHYTPKLPLRLTTDASAYGVGAVLSHVCEDGSERPIAFASRSLSRIMPKLKRRHSWGSKILSISIWATLFSNYGPQAIDQYIWSKNWYSSHGSCSYATMGSLPFSFFLFYRVPSNRLSWKCRWVISFALRRETNIDISSCYNLVQMAALPLTHVQLKGATREDPVLAKVLDFTLKGWPTVVPSEELKPFARKSGELTGSRLHIMGH